MLGHSGSISNNRDSLVTDAFVTHVGDIRHGHASPTPSPCLVGLVCTRSLISPIHCLATKFQVELIHLS